MSRIFSATPTRVLGSVFGCVLAVASVTAQADYVYRIPLTGMQVTPSGVAETGEGGTPEVPPTPQNPFSLSLAAAQLPAARVSRLYSYDFRNLLSMDGTQLPAISDITWEARSALPAGLSLSNTGVLSGTPVSAGLAQPLEIRAYAGTVQDIENYTLTIKPASLFESVSLTGRSRGVAWLNGEFYTARSNGANQAHLWQYVLYKSSDREVWSEAFTFAAGVDAIDMGSAGSRAYILQRSGMNNSLLTAEGSSAMSGVIAPSSSTGVTIRDIPAYGSGTYAMLVLSFNTTTTGSETLRAYTSTDGVSWTQRATKSLGANYGNSSFGRVIHTSQGWVTTRLTASEYWFSADGVTWQTRVNVNWPSGDGVWDGTRLIMTKPNRSFLYLSEDLVTLSEISAPIIPTRVSYSAGVYVISNNSQMAFSTDLLNWEVVNSTNFARHASDGQGNWIFTEAPSGGGSVTYNTYPLD